MKKILILITPIIILGHSCFNKKPCEGSTKTIDYNEKIAVKFVNENDENIFINEMSIDSLTIKDDSSEIMFDYSDGIIEFNLKLNSIDYIENNYNTVIFSELLLFFEKNNVDTLLIKIKPVIYPENCNLTEYENVEIFYNSVLQVEIDNSPCIICERLNNHPLIIKL